MKTTLLKRGAKRGDGSFSVEVIYPGLTLESGDSGVGAIGRIDRAQVRSGHIIHMHPHRDDEILTYVRDGTMIHRDSIGSEQVISATRLMMMNAGHTFRHEEEMTGPGATQALQIFLRPHAADLEPRVQFHDFEDPVSRDAWRLLAAPEEASLVVRAQAWVRDAHLSAGAKLALPPRDAERAVSLLYVYSGGVTLGDRMLRTGEGAFVEGNGEISAEDETDVVLFTTDPAALVFKGGMFSGNVLAR